MQVVVPLAVVTDPQRQSDCKTESEEGTDRSHDTFENNWIRVVGVSIILKFELSLVSAAEKKANRMLMSRW